MNLCDRLLVLSEVSSCLLKPRGTSHQVATARRGLGF